MSDSTTGLSRTIGSATDLRSVVRTMKALAASSVGQYERSVRALDDYCRTVDLRLGACLREAADARLDDEHAGSTKAIGAIVFGSDQGLVGRFNDVIVAHAFATLAALPDQAGAAVRYWAVGERVHAQLVAAGVPTPSLFEVPASVHGIAPLIARLQVAIETREPGRARAAIHVFHNRPVAGTGFEPAGQRLLPLDEAWRRERSAQRWPTATRPDVVADAERTLRGFVREHLFISLYRACAESLASENASRLAAMERADRNIDELLHDLQGRFHRVRQDGIDEELADVTAGSGALS